jgi:exo beta-1,2-glucooligosaccharide sophorohydrolase (non-reducing end)
MSAHQVLAESSSHLYDQHVLFDNAASCDFYYHSQGTFVVPSALDINQGKLPVEKGEFVSPPNSIRLKWNSAPGGDWRVMIHAINRYGHRFAFSGSALAFKCFSDKELRYESSPRIGVQDVKGVSLPDIPLVRGTDSLAAGVWNTVVIPFSSFAAPFGGTAESTFDPSQLASVMFTQGLDDGQDHVMLIDDIRICDPPTADSQAPAPALDFHAVSQDSHIDLSWNPSPSQDVLYYQIDRSTDGKTFAPIQSRAPRFRRSVDHVGRTRGPLHYRLTAIDPCGNASQPVCCSAPATRQFDDDALLDMIQESCFRYYWEGANRDSGMAAEILPGDGNLVALGASGFGVMATVVAVERGFITREEGLNRLLHIVKFLQKADRFHGAWPHFLDGRTGKIWPFFGRYDNGGDLVETAFLMQGLLAARQYFGRPSPGEQELRDTISLLWEEVEWDWYRKTPDSDFLYWHWSPEHAWRISHPLVGWNETMIVYLLAIASPTHSVPSQLYYSGWAGQSDAAVVYRQNWSRTTQGDHYVNGNSYYGMKLDVGEGTGGELFFTQFSFLGFDPRGLRDKYTNYFSNNRTIALINRAYCSDNPKNFVGYGPQCWGRSAGIFSGGGKPLPRDDNGTICCSASLGSFPYTPDESMACLKHFYRDLGQQTFGAYGFHDGFNQTEGWFDEVYMGLNQAQIVVMIENHRSGLIWKSFMANPEIQKMVSRVGFEKEKD